ncbi:MAG TPA: hypothetical protein VD835_00345 [Pyrinomonadaceae bacterium]|nr:hypothetical protein [Pyrinomonadaceae bacterium]
MMTMPRAKALPINCAARNAVWVYPRVAPPRFPRAPAIVETTRSHEMPTITELPDGSDIAVELYGGACALRLDGENRRVYVRRFHYAGFTTQGEARQAFFDLWREVERLGSAEEVERAADGWLERQG